MQKTMDLDGYKELLWKKFPQTDTILWLKNGKKGFRIRVRKRRLRGRKKSSGLFFWTNLYGYNTIDEWLQPRMRQFWNEMVHLKWKRTFHIGNEYFNWADMIKHFPSISSACDCYHFLSTWKVNPLIYSNEWQWQVVFYSISFLWIVRFEKFHRTRYRKRNTFWKKNAE